MKRSLTSLLGALALLTVIHAQQSPSATTNLLITPEPLTAPAGASTTEPQMTVQGDHAILSWLELAGKHTSLKFAERAPSGWSAAQTAASGDDFMVNAADVPSVRRLADGALVAQWLQQDGPDPESYKLRLSWSKDDGRSWSPSVTPHHDKVQTQHGFASLFPVPDVGLGVVWLDGRAIPPDAPEGAGNMALRAATFDSTGKFLQESVVDSRVCECCPTAAAETSDGVIVAYRKRSAGEVRDIYVTRLASGRWTQPVAVHQDGWVIKACPVNGAAISAHGRDVAVAWFTGKGGTGHAFLAFSHDLGSTFTAPVRLDESSSLGRVGVVLLADGSAVGTWVEFANENKPSTFMARRIDARGQRGNAVRIADSGGTRYPRIALSGNELLFAWTQTVDGAPQVRVAHAVVH
jgi:hypothetical protein